MHKPTSESFIPMVDLRSQYERLRTEIQNAVNDVLESTNFIFGPNVNKFEEEIAEYLNIKHALSCASGTDALHLALRALGIGPNDEVITPAFTFAATAEAIRYVNATPVFVDIDPETFNLDPQQVSAAITDKTRAIIIVHLFGCPANFSEIKAVTEDKNIYLVEDCAQSFGASINGIKTGTLGDIACFSFFPSKNLGAYGDGGLISTTNDELAKKIILLRNHGSPERYQHTMIGFNSRLDEIQAAILRVKLKYIDEFNKQRRNIAREYSNAFKNLSVQTPIEIEHYSHVFHQYTLLAPNRNEIIKVLSENNIATSIYYPSGLHQQKAFKDFTSNASLPITEHVTNQCFSLPIFPEISTYQIERIINLVQTVTK